MDVNATGEEYLGVSMLAAAAGAGYLEVVEQLLAAKADVHARASDYGNTVSYEDAKRRSKLNTYYKDYEGTTGLQEAARGGHFEVVERLLEAKADVNEEPDQNCQGGTALQMAAGGGSPRGRRAASRSNGGCQYRCR